MNPATTDGGAYALVQYLSALARAEDRGALAALRRGLGKRPGEAPEMYRYVERHFQAGGYHDGAPPEAYVVASLFGLHPHHVPPEDGVRNFGASLRVIRRTDSGEEDEGVVRRFAALLDASEEALAQHLRHLVTLLISKRPDVAIDYVQLYRDLRYWDRADRAVQKRWASGFWGWQPGEKPDVAAGPSDESTTDDEDGE